MLATSPIAATEPDDQALGALLASLAGVVGCEVALLCSAGGPQSPVIGFSWTRGMTREPIVQPRPGGLIGRALSGRRAMLESLRPEHDLVEVFSDDVGLVSAVAAPVVGRSGVLGALIAGFASGPADHEEALWVVDSYAAIFALALGAPKVVDELLSAASRDALTGCLTYEAAVRELAREINRSSRDDLNLSCLFIDLDDFKRVNDEHGHVHGNEVLAGIGATLRNGVRSCDIVGRYGGDEFIVILPEADRLEAADLAWRLRSKLPAASIGIAQWAAGVSARQLLTLADCALLMAKRRAAGVMLHSGTHVESNRFEVAPRVRQAG